VVRGAAVFDDAGCRACHVGPKLTNNLSVELHGRTEGPLQVPILLGVSYRAPYMVDGSREDLHAASIDMLASSSPGGHLDADALDDLVAYLESL
jgi:cytochrome c peroxidase